jgi:hypothetical protein
MPILKPISGHTSCTGIYRYLTKNGRALARDFLNLDAPEEGDFDWAAVMDETRHAYCNDTTWGDRPARTYKHYVISPDPGDSISLEKLRDLATAWAQEGFADYEVAIVYHDDNENHIPHAHVVVNNTNLVTGRRLQDPSPSLLNHSLQKLAKGMELHDFDSGKPYPTYRNRFKPKTMQREYLRRAERELEAKGEYSWVADIRSRVGIARAIARSEGEFRSVLSAIGVDVADNSPNARRRDWVYSLEGHPTWRVSGERLGLGYGREALKRSFSLGPAGHLSDASERRIFEIAKSAFEIGDLSELKRLSDCVSAIGENGALRWKAIERIEVSDPELAAYIRESGIFTNGQANSPRGVPTPDASFPETPEPEWRSGSRSASQREQSRRQENKERGMQR